MAPAEESSRLDAQVANRHHEGRPYHYTAPSQEDRVRRVFARPDEAPLPAVDDDSLAAYYDHLVAHLSLPFNALHCPAGSELRQPIHYVRVIELADPRQARQRNLHGLFWKIDNAKEDVELPLVDLGVREDDPNCQLIDDYAYWFVNWR
jgi:hypothetical protein